MELIIDILKLVVPTVIALVSLAYAIKQRNVVRKEISKKRYLESALSNLNQAIASIKKAQSVTFGEDSDDLSDIETLVWDILKASFELKKRKISLEVSYHIQDLGEFAKPYDAREKRLIQNLGQYDSSWFTDLWFKSYHKRSVFLESDTRVVGFKRDSGNECMFQDFRVFVGNLIEAKVILSSFEEVYETVAPNSIKKITELIEEVAEKIFETISKPKHIEIDLNKFSRTDEILNHLFEEITNYSSVADKVSKASEIITELEKARKELFLKIS